jgi:hypothetical protein
MKIQPITTWQNGLEKQANNFVLSIVNDNLINYCTFNYQLQRLIETIIPATETEPAQIITNADTLISGNLSIEGQDYQDWDASPSANQWAYEWAAKQLNLVLIPE